MIIMPPPVYVLPVVKIKELPTPERKMIKIGFHFPKIEKMVSLNNDRRAMFNELIAELVRGLYFSFCYVDIDTSWHFIVFSVQFLNEMNSTKKMSRYFISVRRDSQFNSDGNLIGRVKFAFSGGSNIACL